MTPQTPLAEVAQFLPTDMAKALMQHPGAQTYVVRQLRTMLVALERTGVQLDPLQAEAVLLAHCTLALGAWLAVVQMQTKNRHPEEVSDAG